MSHLILHEYAQSGNCYKIRLTAARVGVAIALRHYPAVTAWLARVAEQPDHVPM